MKKQVIIPIVLIVLAIGIGAYFLINKDSNESTEEQSEQSITETQTQDEASFNPLATEGESFVATMSGTTADSETFEATIEYDGNGNSHYTGVFDNETTFEFYTLQDRTIFCAENQCFESPTALESSPIDKSQYEYTTEDLLEYREGAVYKGKQDCNAGSCDTWEITREGYTGTLYLDSDGRINKAQWEGNEGLFTLEYIYEPVAIVIPENILSIPGAS